LKLSFAHLPRVRGRNFNVVKFPRHLFRALFPY
jgi:hypothetical protein